MIAKNNLKKARENLRISTIKLAELVSTNHQNITRWELHQRKLPIEWATKIAPHLNTTVSQLLGLEELNTDSNINKESFTEEPIKTAEELRAEFNYNKYNAPVEVKLFNQEFACGAGSEPLNYEDVTPLYFTKDLLRKLTGTINNIIAVTSSGNSMEPFIKDKDIVFVDCSKTEITNTKNHNKSIFAFRYDSRLCIKHLVLDKKTNIITAHSFNKAEHKPFTINLTKYPDFHIIGKIIGTYSKA